MQASPAVSGVRIDPLDRADVLLRMREYLTSRQSHVVHFVSAHPTVVARRDSEYRRLLNRGDLNLPDGASVSLALRLQGHKASRMTGSDAFDMLCRWGLSRGSVHFLYGGTPDVLANLRTRLEERHPGIRIVGGIAPPFRPMTRAELEADARTISASHADFVWVGLGTPKQDVVADSFCGNGCAPVILAVGAAFDFAAGAKRRAPRWMRLLGLEWFFRLAQEPRRLGRRYLIGNPQFIAGVLRDALLGPAHAVKPVSSE